MKFWLIVFLFTADGEFIGKHEQVYPDSHECLIAAGQMQIQYVNSSTGLAAFCVTEDHYYGRSQDENVPLDF